MLRQCSGHFNKVWPWTLLYSMTPYECTKKLQKKKKNHWLRSSESEQYKTTQSLPSDLVLLLNCYSMNLILELFKNLVCRIILQF